MFPGTLQRLPFVQDAYEVEENRLSLQIDLVACAQGKFRMPALHFHEKGVDVSVIRFGIVREGEEALLHSPVIRLPQRIVKASLRIPAKIGSRLLTLLFGTLK